MSSSKKIPGSLIAIIVVTIAVYLMKTYGGITCIDIIGDRFTIQSQLPAAVVPELNWEAIKNLVPVAITIAVLGAIESLLSAAVADGVIEMCIRDRNIFVCRLRNMPGKTRKPRISVSRCTYIRRMGNRLPEIRLVLQ